MTEKLALWTGSAEDFLRSKGWKLINGYRIDLESLMCDAEDLDYLFIESTEDFIKPCEYWVYENEAEELANGRWRAYDDADIAIEECYEEYFDDDGNLYNQPVNEEEAER